MIGNALTDMSAASGGGTLQADGSMRGEATFDVQHVANTIVYIASLPNSVQALNITLMYVYLALTVTDR